MKLQKLNRETRGLKLFPLFTLVGWLLAGFAIVIWAAVFSPTAVSYWGGNAKAARDAAEIGSVLVASLSNLAFWSKFLPPLVFLGVASFMAGIALEFHAIPRILDRRIDVLKQAVPLMGHN